MLAAAAACLALAACGSDETESDAPTERAANPAESTPTGATPDQEGAAEFEEIEPGSGEGTRIGYVSVGEQISFGKFVSDGIRRAADEAGAELIFCDSKVDAAIALQCAQNMKTKQVEVLVQYQNDAEAAPEICAAGPDVPVISVSIHQEPCGVTFTGADNELAGQLAGESMGQFVKEEFNCEYDAVVLLEATRTGEINETRVRGALAAFEEVCGKVENLRAVDAGGAIEEYRTKFADTLTALPGRDRIIILTINDDAALGALAAAKSQGRADDIYIAAQGADESAHCEIANNPQWVGDVAYFPERWGQIIVPNAIRLAAGETVPDELLVPHVFVTSETIGEYYDVSAC